MSPDVSQKTLAALAPIRPGEVVSRAVHRADGGTVTVLAFGEGAELREHTSPREVVIVVTEGELDIEVGDRTSTLAAGDALTLPPDLPHAVAARTDARMLLVQLRTAS